ncbi:MAG: hypothetical protein KBT34_05335, partial [Prevotella sp.]|nr:hypothetical protein [Candidatus Prevotella equi]
APNAVETAPAAEGVVLVATEYYTADGKHINTNGEQIDFNHLPMMPRGMVIIVRKHYSNGTSKTQKFTF